MSTDEEIKQAPNDDIELTEEELDQASKDQVDLDLSEANLEE